MEVGWAVGALVLGGILIFWGVLIFGYFLVIALLERSDADEESASAASTFELLEAMDRHPSGRHRNAEPPL